MKLVKLVIATVTIASCILVGLTDSAQAGRRRGGSSSNLGDKDDDFTNPVPTLIFNDAVTDSDSNQNSGKFIGAIESFSYLRNSFALGPVNEPFFAQEDGSAPLFYETQGSLTSALDISAGVLNYEIAVEDSGFSMRYPFQYSISFIQTELGLDNQSIKDNLVNSLSSFFDLVDTDPFQELPGIATDVSPAPNTCALFVNAGSPCKIFDEFKGEAEADVINRFTHISAQNLEGFFLVDGGDPGALRLGAEIPEAEDVPEPGIVLGLFTFLATLSTGINYRKKEEAI